MICTEFSSYIKQDILILPQAGSILALLPDREAEDSNIKEIFARIVDRTQREYGIELRIGAGNSRAYLDEVKDSRNEASSALRAAEAFRIEGADISLQGSGNLYITFPCGRFQNPGYLYGRKNRKAAAGR